MAINATQAIIEALVLPSGTPIRTTMFPIEVLISPSSVPIRATILTVEVLIREGETPPEPPPTTIIRHGPRIQVI